MASDRPRGPGGLQVWLIGDGQQLGAGRDALAERLTITKMSAREPVGQGRFRVYLEATPRTVTPWDGSTRSPNEQPKEGLWPAT